MRPLTPAVFLDRDGVLSLSIVRNGKPFAPTRLEDFALYPEVPEQVQQLRSFGLAIVVVTNQPDVGHGLVARETVEAMHAILRETIVPDLIQVCYHRQDEGCSCRKPKPGMLLLAAAELGIDLSRSFMVGDRWSDIDAGVAAGCWTIFLDRGYGEKKPPAAWAIVGSLGEAIERIAAEIRRSSLMPAIQ